MQKRIDRLKKMENDMIKHAEKRDKTSMKRSEEWSKSPQGKLYEHQTGLLANTVESIRDTIKVMESFIQ